MHERINMHYITTSLQRKMTSPCKQAHAHAHAHSLQCVAYLSTSISALPLYCLVFHLLAALFMSYLRAPASSLELPHYKCMLSQHQLCRGRVLVLQWKQLTTTAATIALTRTNDISEPARLLATRWLTRTGQRWASAHHTSHKQLNGTALLFRLLRCFFYSGRKNDLSSPLVQLNAFLDSWFVLF